jgi:alanyl-tRNA synthetase
MSTPVISVADIRKTFLDFFASKGHTVVASSPLVPGNDPTLMFTNSGMVQFKDVFLGSDKRSYVRAASVQACLRAGGKHNDLENVGYTARHHTFFEMLGNWSFGDYFKRDSLKWAFELLTEVYKLPAEKLWATVYIEDDEAYAIWTQEIGLPPERVVRIGDNKGGRYMSDNFWMMADTGPCGPCSEIFYDHGPEIAGGPPGSPEQDGDRYIEIWNNVFMQFDMQPDGSLNNLPAPCVDTGMGLERLAAILQHVHSNYEIDIFDALIKAASRETGCTDLQNKSLRVIADHIRATAFLVSDGVVPSNEGRGYVQRRIVRRAIRHGYKLGQKTPFFHKLVPDLVKLMGAAYPSLASQEKRITDILKAEEERFFETLEVGMQILDSALEGGVKVLPGDVAFKLHDTYGFPLDLSADVCRERDLSVDEAGFSAAMERQKSQARAAGKFKMDRALEYTGAGNTFVGYNELQATAKVLALYVEGTPAAEMKAGQSGVVVLDTTPFYAESGGQVGDQGLLQTAGSQFEVEDTLKIKADVFGHHGVLTQGSLKVGDAAQSLSDPPDAQSFA